MGGAKEVQVSGGKSMPIREFNLDWMCKNPSICMIAKRGSGKSWVCRAILKHFSYLPGGVIIAKTERMSTFYGNFFPDSYIHYEYKSEILENLLYRQEQIIEKCKQKYNQGKKVDPRAFLLMDDCLASKGTWMNDQPILEVFYNGRHYQLLFVLTMQFPLGIRPELRCNFDYIFLLAEDFYSNQKRLYDHYAGMFPSFDLFRQVFLQVTDDFGSMVIVNRGSRKDILDKVFYYKAPNEEIGTIGCDQFKKFHSKNYNTNWKTEGKSFDMNNYVKKNKQNIVVSKVHDGGQGGDQSKH
jgi:hypothetical protein